MKLDDPPVHQIHRWLMSAARQCQLQGITAGEAESILSAFESRLRRKYQPNEVVNAVEKAYSTTLPPRHEDKKWEDRRKPAPRPQPTKKTDWVKAKTNMLKIKHGVTNADVWEQSPTRCDDELPQSWILDALFPDPEGLVCVGKSAWEFHTARLNQFKDLSKLSFIVPCYMTAKHGQTQNGKRSMHTLDNCGPRRFCVCDFDEPSSDHHASIIWHLKDAFDLVMVLTSGRRSLHAWFNVPADEEDEFWKAAIPLGADPALMRNRSSFVRMPMGTRDNGKPQSVIYFDHGKLDGEETV